MIHKYKFTLLPLLFLITLNLCLRIPYLYEPAYSDDEHFFLTIGRAIKNGSVLYRDISDITIVRPPLIYLIASVFDTQISFRTLLTIWSCLTIIIFYFLIKNLTFSNRNAFLATLIFIFLVSSPFLEGNRPYNEIFYTGFTVIAAFIFSYLNHWTLPPRRLYFSLFACGLFLGFGFSIKIPVIFDFLAFVVTLILFPFTSLDSKAINSRQIIILLLGFCASIFLVYLAHPFPPSSFITLIKSDLVQLKHIFPILYPHQIANVFIFKIILFSIPTFILIYHYRYLTRMSFFISLWGLASLFSSLLTNSIGLHYTIQFIPPLVTSVFLAFKTTSPLASSIILMPAVFFTLLHLIYPHGYSPVISYYSQFIKYFTHQSDQNSYFQSFTPHTLRNYQVADYLINHTSPNDHVFLWSYYTEIYTLSDTLPSSKYIWSEHIETTRWGKPTLSELIYIKPKFIITFQEIPIPKFFANYISKNFNLVATISANEYDLDRAFIYARN